MPVSLPCHSAAGVNREGIERFCRGDLPGALACFEQAQALDASYAEPCSNAGLVQQRLGRLADALASYREALLRRPDYAEALCNRAGLWQLLGQGERALADLDSALTLASEELAGSVYHNRGGARQERGDLEGALADYDEALRRQPDLLPARINRGTVRKELGDLAGALADFEHALEHAPPRQAAPAYHGRGGVLVLQNDFAAALTDYDRALELDPGYVVAYVSRGHARYHLRDRGAVMDYFRAFSLDAVLAAREVARVVRADASARPEEALRNCQQHIRTDPSDALAHARQGLTLLALGREEEAAGPLAEACQLVPGAGPLLAAVIDELRRPGTFRGAARG